MVNNPLKRPAISWGELALGGTVRFPLRMFPTTYQTMISRSFFFGFEHHRDHHLNNVETFKIWFRLNRFMGVFILDSSPFGALQIPMKHPKLKKIPVVHQTHQDIFVDQNHHLRFSHFSIIPSEDPSPKS